MENSKLTTKVTKNIKKIILLLQKSKLALPLPRFLKKSISLT